ncbi:ATPase component of ABC transporter with duplicated ATPase domain [Gynuella sunshinyii YC6258]|uniref:ATPase component of ABC transporter with duplicated ATPase domain n=2 Tax=Gynuella sunshinyii TaxID=1445505 RepID=A0A0C5VJ91_9GAMM|nr:ATPase component of ABC transporter with duplicated ATPase domain [Gynuella sunshinyii YC6258]
MLFESLNLNIHSGDKIGLVGHNGCGKSTLFALLYGTQEPDSGEVIRARGVKISWVEQFVPEQLLEMTLLDSILQSLEPEKQLYEKYRVETLLSNLGFQPSQCTSLVKTLSGGQKNLVLFARAIINEPELLLMDEPGNHMDVLALANLTGFLQTQQHISFIMVSHDRQLLNDCCNKTIFLRDGRSYSFDLPFSHAKEKLQQADVVARQKRESEEREIKRIKISANRLARWGRDYDNEDLSRKAKTMERRVERLQENLTAVSQGSGLTLKLDSQQLQAKTMLILEQMNIRHSIDQPPLVHCEYLTIRPGDRIALLGRNGVGKSSTLNAWMTQYREPANDTIRFNPGTAVFYYDQELNNFQLPESRFEWLRQRAPGTDEQIRQTLISAGIPYQHLNQRCVQLSGGEQARMMFMLMQLQQPNFIILDEPTNHIDLDGREQLEQQLVDSGATLLLTSHDRLFLEAVANRYWLIENGILREIHDPEIFYQGLQQTHHEPFSRHSKIIDEPKDEENMLMEIEQLETLLKEDKQRKPRFQKPEKQQQWQSRIAELWQQLER